MAAVGVPEGDKTRWRHATAGLRSRRGSGGGGAVSPSNFYNGKDTSRSRFRPPPTGTATVPTNCDNCGVLFVTCVGRSLRRQPNAVIHRFRTGRYFGFISVRTLRKRTNRLIYLHALPNPQRQHRYGNGDDKWGEG
jgi:hypothetical protein